MKKKRTYAAIVKDLEREIKDLRAGIAKQTEMIGWLHRDNLALKDTLRIRDNRIRFLEAQLNAAVKAIDVERTERRQVVRAFELMAELLPRGA